MDLTAYLIDRCGGTGKASCPALAALAHSAEVSPSTLYMIALGHKRPGPALAARIDASTGGQVTRAELRPDVFGPGPARGKRKAA